IDQDEEQELGVTPLPVRQLAILCLMRATEPISFTVIFPFINQMIEDLKIAPDPSQVGFYAGLIESIFALSQFCTALLWGKLSDRVGRKPILSVGLLGLSLGTTLFGFQKTFIGLIISRSFAGALNGNIAIVKTVIAEITDETNQAKAFVLPPLCYAIGLSIGPAIGGYAAKPAEQYPSIELFKRFKIFSDFPYFLPCLIASLLNIFAFFLGFFYLEERQPSETDALLSTNNKKHMGASNQTVKSLMTKPVLRVLLSFSCLSIQNSAWQALVPLFSYTRLEDGGLGLSMHNIGSVLSLGGLIALCLQTGLFPTLQRKFGTLKLYRIVTLGFPISFLILPLIRIVIIRFIKTEQSYEGAEVQISMIGLVIDLIFKGIANLSIVCIALLISNSAPTQSSLGTLNGIGQSCASLGRTVGPGLTGFLFSSSVRLKFPLIWYILLIIGGFGYWTTWLVKDIQPEWRKKPKKVKRISKNNSLQK
ncbi:major facilitator superfamily domain-containing protein, partial [Phakopsora pachyrhizi]